MSVDCVQASRDGLEIWRRVPGFDGRLAVSNLGRVKHYGYTVARSNGSPQTVRAREVKVHPAGHNYPTIRFKEKAYKVANLMLETFVGPRPTSTHQARHLDDDRTNSMLWNLAWGTKKENYADRVRNGIDIKGEKHCNAKLREYEVMRIKQRLRQGERCAIIAADYDVSLGAIQQIAYGNNWKHVTI